MWWSGGVGRSVVVEPHPSLHTNARREGWNGPTCLTWLCSSNASFFVLGSSSATLVIFPIPLPSAWCLVSCCCAAGGGTCLDGWSDECPAKLRTRRLFHVRMCRVVAVLLSGAAACEQMDGVTAPLPLPSIGVCVRVWCPLSNQARGRERVGDQEPSSRAAACCWAGSRLNHHDGSSMHQSIDAINPTRPQIDRGKNQRPSRSQQMARRRPIINPRSS